MKVYFRFWLHRLVIGWIHFFVFFCGTTGRKTQTYYQTYSLKQNNNTTLHIKNVVSISTTEFSWTALLSQTPVQLPRQWAWRTYVAGITSAILFFFFACRKLRRPEHCPLHLQSSDLLNVHSNPQSGTYDIWIQQVDGRQTSADSHPGVPAGGVFTGCHRERCLGAERLVFVGGFGCDSCLESVETPGGWSRQGESERKLRRTKALI